MKINTKLIYCILIIFVPTYPDLFTITALNPEAENCCSVFPVLKPLNNQVSMEINRRLLQEIIEVSDDNDTSCNCFWSELDFDHEINNDILYVKIYGHYENYMVNPFYYEYFFSLKNGDLLFEKSNEQDFQFFPIHSFFKKGILDTLRPENWLKDCSSSMSEATECADGISPSCTCNGFTYTLSDTSLVFTFDPFNQSSCYPVGLNVCTPDIVREIPLDSLKLVVSELGLNVLFNTDYLKASRLGKFIIYNKICDSLKINKSDFSY